MSRTPPVGATWPLFATAASQFYNGHLARPRKLFAAFVPVQKGSGRPAGPRELYWPTTIALAIAALEAGLEDVLFAAHGVRQGDEGNPITNNVNCVDGNPHKWLVADRLMAPGSQKIERVLFADFGVVLGALPQSARFAPISKPWSKGGYSRGTAIAGPTTWSGLRAYLDAMNHIRNATAHGDATKLGQSPTACKGTLWLLQQSGAWSVQLPHALTALRATLSVFNVVVTALASRLNIAMPQLTVPNTIDYPA
ncbi:hypothetical protein [Gemmatimonas sp.]|uniref:hypothetical protein n=1 Tax=Gemmatimonas sp. TaxID=1962908 RepID=UPI00356A2BB2